ncbi:membrane transport protein-domain-containing protein [Piptocephalis cylindrospora]|uniref:Membrane transport protein-domain-containing protein n=1 Tax=Piptocephalis cylindrospora TaxID=1907219 RepID=A0A4P9Y3R5_9FUNG|nr:membrane transport protein-domain-containing protein [Piptocephalis cylindrospora]|eukprot:RKP12450.1 membrane transport protein-domain-containing protein [Piptocephalis cylindrospora]
MNAFATIAITAVQSISQVVCTGLFGHILAKRNILTPPLQRGLSQLTICLFTPCLLFSNTVRSIRQDTVMDLWPIPCYLLLFTFLSMSLASISARFLHLTPSQSNFMRATLTFSNTNTLPIALVESLSYSSALPWLQSPGKSEDELEDSEDIAARGVSFIVFYSILGNLIRWSYGTTLLSKDEDAQISGSYSDRHTPQRGAEEEGGAQRPHTPSPSSPVSANHHPILMTRGRPAPRRQEEMAGGRERGEPFSNPPTVGALLGMFVALTPAIRDLLIPQGAPLYTTLFKAVDGCGKASVPLIVVCLGAQLTTLSRSPPSPSQGHHGEEDSERLALNPPSPYAYPSYASTVTFASVGRLILLPCLCLLSVMLTLPLAGALGKDPVFLLTILLLGSAPTAINLMTVCQANGCFERPMGRVLLTQYTLGSITLVGWCMAFLVVVRGVYAGERTLASS